MRHRPEDYSVLWKPAYDISRPRGQQHSIAVAFSALRFTIGPLGNERPNKWIHQSVCVLLSVCIWDAVRPRRAQSPGTQRKGMPLLAGLMNGWHAAPWQRRMWQPPSRKRGAVLNYRGEITWCWPPPFPSCIPYWLSLKWWKNQRVKGGERRISDHPIEWLPPFFSPHIGGEGTNKHFFKLRAVFNKHTRQNNRLKQTQRNSSIDLLRPELMQ